MAACVDEKQKDLTGVVAKHYNELQETGLEERTKSRIFYLRNFNNWIKSMAIGNYLSQIKKDRDSSETISVLDLCCGKGGDLLKWKKGHIDHLICADIAKTSVEQCESRYKEMVDRNNKERYPQKTFTAEFFDADCTKKRLKELFKKPDTEFNLVSCQFSFHYSFESYEQADMMLCNACESLKPGGFFIGTTPNSNEIIKRLRNSETTGFGNDVYSVTFDSEDKTNIPLFGARYMFHLEGVVECPEFLVHFPTMENLAEKYGMKLVMRMPFAEFFEEHISQNDGRGLIGRMQGLEPYPADEDVDLMSKGSEAYKHVAAAVEQQTADSKQDGDSRRNKPVKMGTLSQEEWEAGTIYLVFAFQKIGGVAAKGDEIVKRADKRSADKMSKSQGEDADILKDEKQSADNITKSQGEDADVKRDDKPSADNITKSQGEDSDVGKDEKPSADNIAKSEGEESDPQVDDVETPAKDLADDVIKPEGEGSDSEGESVQKSATSEDVSPPQGDESDEEPSESKRMKMS